MAANVQQLKEVLELRERYHEVMGTVQALTERLERIERAESLTPRNGRWWERELGRFANDPVWEEISREGQTLREADRLTARAADDNSEDAP